MDCRHAPPAASVATAFIFDLTRPKLLQLPWFRSLYDRVMVWLAWAHDLIDPIKRRLNVAPHVRAQARGPHAPAARAHPPAHAGIAGGGVTI